MTSDGYMVAITALLPLMAILLVLQTNPYQALVIRGILGAIAALVYTLYGAADVALTEALVGTMLSITLYAIAVRSSMTVRIGVIEKPIASSDERSLTSRQVLTKVEDSLRAHHVRIELVSYPDVSALNTALESKDIHVTYESSAYLKTRVERLYNILQSSVPTTTRVGYLNVDKQAEKIEDNLAGKAL